MASPQANSWRAPWARNYLCIALLIAINAWIGWRLFWIEYTEHIGSLAGAYMSLARYIQFHWPLLDWFPLWRGGMPFENTYQPLWHVATALVASIGHLSPGRAYFFMAGVAYCAEAPAVFLMTRRLTGAITPALWAGLLVSLCSPSAMLVRAIAQDIGGTFNPHRLHVILTYADVPHAAGLAMLPLAIFFLDHARESRNLRWWVASAAMCGAIILTNIPATIVLLFAIIAYSLAFGGCLRNLAAPLAGYALVCAWFPPSTIRDVLVSTQQMDPANNAFGTRHLLYLPIGAAVTFGLAAALKRARIPPALRFLWLFACLTAGITLANFWFGITLIAQPRRFQMAMSLAVSAAVAVSVYSLSRNRTWTWIASNALIIALCVAATVQYRKAARAYIQPLDITWTSQYKIAQWMEAHAAGRRVLVMGSSSFWLNVFGETPQITGCCDQGLILPVTRIAAYVIGTDSGTGGRAFEISRDWLVALGVHLAAVSGPGSSEAYWDWKNPRKFEGKLTKAWQDGGDTIYEIPQVTRSLAHPVAAGEIVSRVVTSGLDVPALEPYVAALLDPDKATLDTTWIGTSTLAIRGSVAAGEKISVQIPYQAGWKAISRGRALNLSADGLGFIVIEPPGTGPVEISLKFGDAGDKAIGRIVGMLALAGALALLLAPSLRLRANFR